MKRSVVVVSVLAAVLLIAGLVLGLRPITAPVTLVNPEIRELSLPCGIGYLPGAPSGPASAGPGDTVRPGSDPGVALPRPAYAEHCAMVTGWRPYAAWGLTGLGVVGLALLFAGRSRADTTG